MTDDVKRYLVSESQLRDYGAAVFNYGYAYARGNTIDCTQARLDAQKAARAIRSSATGK
jgi:hypothetical protein